MLSLSRVLPSVRFENRPFFDSDNRWEMRHFIVVPHPSAIAILPVASYTPLHTGLSITWHDDIIIDQMYELRLFKPTR